MRRRGHPPRDAADLTQEYFTPVIQGGLLFLPGQRVGPRSRPEARRGAEARLGLGPSEETNPDRLFDRAWALSLLDRAYDRLASDEAEAGRAAAFERLKVFLTKGSRATPYAVVAAALGTTVIAVQSSVARLRRRYRAILREEVAETLAEPSEAEIDFR